MKKLRLMRTLAISGTILVLVPVVFMLLTSIAHLVRAGILRMDYLIPAELFLVVAVGGGLLAWAALASKKRQKEILWLLGLAIVLLFAGQGFAMITGLATGKISPDGWQFSLVMGLFIAYDLAVAALGIVGVLLIRDIRTKQEVAS